MAVVPIVTRKRTEMIKVETEAKIAEIKKRTEAYEAMKLKALDDLTPTERLEFESQELLKGIRSRMYVN